MSSGATTFPQLLARSKFATFDPLISRIYTTPSKASKRGDWGFKYTLPPSSSARPRPKYLKVTRLGGISDYRSGEKEARFVERWGDGRYGWIHNDKSRSSFNPLDDASLSPSSSFYFRSRQASPYATSRGRSDLVPSSAKYTPGGARKDQLNTSDLVSDTANESDGSTSASVLKKLFVPDLELMSEREFHAYLRNIREKVDKKDFAQFLADRNKANSSPQSPARTKAAAGVDSSETAQEASNSSDSFSLIDLMQKVEDVNESNQYLSRRTTAAIEDMSSRQITPQPHSTHGLAYSRPSRSNLDARSHSPLTVLPGRVLESDSLDDYRLERDQRSRYGGTGSRGSQSTVVGLGGLTASSPSGTSSSVDWEGRRPFDKSQGAAYFRVQTAAILQPPTVVQHASTVDPTAISNTARSSLPNDFSFDRARAGRVSPLKQTSPLDTLQVNVKVNPHRNTAHQITKSLNGAAGRGDKEWVAYSPSERFGGSVRPDGLAGGSSKGFRSRLQGETSSKRLEDILKTLKSSMGPNPTSFSNRASSEPSDAPISSTRSLHTSSRSLTQGNKPTADPTKIEEELKHDVESAHEKKEVDGNLAKGNWRDLEDKVAGDVRYGSQDGEKSPASSGPAKGLPGAKRSFHTTSRVQKAEKARPSILQPGSVMKGLSVLKDKSDPVVLPDNEYPDWLWTLTDEAAAKSGTSEQTEAQVKSAFDYHAERKKLRASNKSDIKARNFLKST